jgi:hypothetical protein
LTFNRIHGTVFQQKELFVTVAVRTSNLQKERISVPVLEVVKAV